MRSDAKQGSIRLGSFFLSLQLPAARWWLSRPLSPSNRASSKEFLLLPAPRRRRWLGHCAKVNIYVAGAFLPLSFIFSPFLKCHRSAVFIIVQEMSFPLAGSLTPSCTEAAPLLPAPTSTQDLQWMASARREMGQGQASRHRAAQLFNNPCGTEEPHCLVRGSAYDPRRHDALFMPLGNKHPQHNSTASCLYATQEIQAYFKLATFSLFFGQLSTGEVAK